MHTCIYERAFHISLFIVVRFHRYILVIIRVIDHFAGLKGDCSEISTLMIYTAVIEFIIYRSFLVIPAQKNISGQCIYGLYLAHM